MDYIDYFHYPESKSPQYKQNRQDTTDKYGNITVAILFGFLVIIGSFNSLIKWGINFHRFKVIKFINKLPENKVTRLLKNVLLVVLYHLPTAFQIVFWLTVLSVLSLSDLNDGDLIFLAKRLGRISYNCLPTVFFLSLRPSPLPNTLYLSLLPIHKWLSRIIILQSILHTLLYIGFFNINNTWFKLFKLENWYGIIALASFLIILVTSFLRFRNNHYKMFYNFHYCLSWLIVITLQFHVRPSNSIGFTSMNLCILIGQLVYRFRLTTLLKPEDFKITNISPHLILVEFPKTLISKESINPGSHIRLTNKSNNPITNFFKQTIPNYHPYTLVSLPNNFKQKLIIKKGTFKFSHQQYYVTGSYNANLLFLDNKENKFSISKVKVNTKKILIIIGGSAISFALPILRVMNYHGIPVRLIWVVKDFRDIIVLKYFDGFIHSDDIEIYVTGPEIITDTTDHGSYSTYGTINTEEDQDYPQEEDRRNFEDENVDIAIGEEFCDEFDSFNDTLDTSSVSSVDSLQTSHSNGSSKSIKTNISNERFKPKLDTSNNITRTYVNSYIETIKRLHLSNKVFKGRPKLNNKYYNWCLNDSPCTGPIEVNNHLVCCRDLPQSSINMNHESQVWVISAGPKGLVQNVKVWAKENGLKFHEEAFYT